ncbi:MAG: hypothetical protein EA370_05300 [Wenzhouxiangella sp.]|nr:MAG: hypothetical protein EA370_05300 [Wenzhouxiangella sp.]
MFNLRRFVSSREQSQSDTTASSLGKKSGLASFVGALAMLSGSATATIPIANDPLFAVADIPPLVLLAMSNDHQLFFEAYPDYADLTGDGISENGYNHDVVYFGYFDSFKCYNYSAGSGRFVPAGITTDRYCDGVAGDWSGNFLNYVTMARIDVVRKILYGGFRSTDTAALTVLERSYLPNDAHSWVRFYDGADLHRLTPYTLPEATTTTSTSNITIPAGSRNADGDRRIFTTNWTSSLQRQIGDQLVIRSTANPEHWMMGVIRAFPSGAGNRIEVQVTSSNGVGVARDSWEIVNESRRGISFCNTTVSSGERWSQNVTDPPLMRVASGNYSLWTGNERWQCRWSEERSRTGHNQMQIGGLSFSNGNAMSFTSLPANSDNPLRDQVGLGNRNYNVRVEACVSETLIGEESCKQYPDGNLKPVGLLQEFGDNGDIRFGLISGSFQRNTSGGILRRNIGLMAEEINVNTNGTFRPVNPVEGSIIRAVDSFRMFGYDHNSGQGLYNNNEGGLGDNCPWALNTFNDGRCRGWGNPQSEIFLEGLRYLAGLDPTTAFTVGGANPVDAIAGLPVVNNWRDPLGPQNWCAGVNMIKFNSSVSSYDGDQLGGATELGMTQGLNHWTNIVGAGEGIHGGSFFVGESGANNNQVCTAKTVDALSGVAGICPEAPRLQGTYHIAGLAHFAYTQSIRTLQTPAGQNEGVNVKTFGVSLAPAVPRIDIPRPGGGQPVTLLPSCRNDTVRGNCAIVDFRIVEQNIAAGTGKFLVQWEDSEQGGDFDMDMNGVISYQITANEITVTTNVFSQSTGYQMGFGYVIGGTTADGFHAHSGINNFTRAGVSGVPGCTNCVFSNAPTSHTFTLGGSAGQSLEAPLFYAAKWGGFNKARNFPSDPLSWDSSGDGLPDNYFFAVDPAELLRALRAAFQQVLTDVEAVTVTTSTSRLDAGAVIFEAGLNTDDWTGDVTAIDPLTDAIRWQASNPAINQPGNRNIWIGTGNSAESFSAATLTAGLRTRLFSGIEALQANPGCSGAESENWYCGLDSTQLINFLRGVDPADLNHANALRERASFIGTVVNSDTVLSLSQDFVDEGWGRLGGQVGEDYFEFVDRKVADLGDPDDPANPSKAVVMVGSNAGMLHAFSVETGREVFSYIPSMIIESLYRQANPDFRPEPLVDGRFAVADAYLDGRWRRVLVGATGGGAKGLYALDITDPASFGQTSVLWELTPDALGAANLGHAFSAPVITRLADERFVAIFGNGVNGADEVPELFVVNLEDGSVIDSLKPAVAEDTRTASNGLMGVGIALSPLTRTHVDRVYAGDLNGRLWRFRMDDSSIDDARLFFEAPETQPITAPPTVAVSVQGGWEIYFGTGRFFADEDNLIDPTNEPVQSFYLVRDTNQDQVRRPADLGRAAIDGQTTVAGGPSRIVRSNDFDRRGWALDFTNPAGGTSGERIVRRANVGFGAVIFNTYEPVEDICEGGGVSRIYVLDTVTGEGLLLGLGDDVTDPAASVQIPGSAPIAPPILIRNVQVDDRVPDDPDDPFQPGAPLPTLPTADGLDRTTWCSQFGVRLQGLGFQPLGTVCDGRQIWRQIR